MNRIRYFKEKASSTFGEECMSYYEYTDTFCTRQTYVFDNRVEIYSQEPDNPNFNMTDRLLGEYNKLYFHEITQEEFENVWQQGLKSE